MPLNWQAQTCRLTTCDRIRLLATVTGFSSNAASAHSHWLSENGGIPKWHQQFTGKLLSEPQSDSVGLTVQVALCARFDRSELNVETIRYFHDDAAIVDLFDEEVVQTVPLGCWLKSVFFWCRRTGHGLDYGRISSGETSASPIVRIP
jgi:hypothetical protein